MTGYKHWIKEKKCVLYFWRQYNIIRPLTKYHTFPYSSKWKKPILIHIWLKDYLSVKHHAGCSSWGRIIPGVPQGSILNWSLAVINNIVTTISAGSEINMFADDIAIYHTTASITVLQEDISAVASFLNYRHLNFNEDKCCTMLISRKRSNSLSLQAISKFYRLVSFPGEVWKWN